jgi:hypothetical protein
VLREDPAFSSWDISGGCRGLDPSPGAMSGKANHGIPDPGAGTAGLAGRVRVRRRAHRNAPSGGRIPRQRSRAVAPFANRLGPLIPSSLEPVPNCATRISSGEYRHDGGDPQFGQSVRMSGVVGRQVNREAGFDCRSDQAPVLDSDRVVAQDGLVGEGDHILAGVGSDEPFEARTVDLRAISRQVACLGITPKTSRPERRNLGAELGPGPRQLGRGTHDPNAWRGRRIQHSSRSQTERIPANMTPARQSTRGGGRSSRFVKLRRTVLAFYFSIEARSASTARPRYTAA